MTTWLSFRCEQLLLNAWGTGMGGIAEDVVDLGWVIGAPLKASLLGVCSQASSPP